MLHQQCLLLQNEVIGLKKPLICTCNVPWVPFHQVFISSQSAPDKQVIVLTTGQERIKPQI